MIRLVQLFNRMFSQKQKRKSIFLTDQLAPLPPGMTKSGDGGAVDLETNGRSEKRFRLVLQTCRIGMWEWDLTTNEVKWSPELEAIHGLAPGTFQGTFSAYQQDIHPDDRKRVLATIEQTVEQGKDYHLEYRIIWPDGSLHWVEGRGKLFPEQNGSPALMLGICMDITERKCAEEALRESEQRFTRFMQHLPGLAWLKDLEGRYVFVNDAAEFAFQTPRENLYGKKDDDLFPREVAAQFQENDSRALETGTGIQVIETLQQADGVIHHSIVSKFPISGPDGKPMFIGGMAIDITDQKRVEEALRERDEQYALIVAGAEAAIWDWNVAAKRVFFSSRWKEIRGLSDDEVSDREEEWSSRIHPDDFVRVMAALQAHFEGRTDIFNEEYRVRHKDGHWIWIADRGIARRNETGKIIRMAGSETNITQRKQAEQALLEREKETRRLLELNKTIMVNMGEGLYTIDAHGLVTYINPEAERMFGWEPGELLGRRMHEVTHYKHPDGSPFPIEECTGFQVLREGKILRDFEDTFIRKDGSFFPVSFSSSPLRDQKGKIVGLVIVFQDITERKRAEEELRRLKDELEVRVQDRTRELLASQGLLRSLASQLSLAEEHARRKLASGLHDYLAQLLVVGRMKLDQVKDMVSLSPEAGDVIQDLENILQQALTYSRTTIAELSPPTLHEAGLPMAFIWLSERMKQHGLRVEVQTDGPPVQLPDDLAILLFQSVRELLFNVLKHAGVDRAWVSLTAGPNGAVGISVEDQGKGLDADAMQRALEPGHLGLFAVRERLEAMGGSVELKSVAGQGTRVTLLLPVCGTSQMGSEHNQPEDEKVEQAILQEQVSIDPQPDAELPHPIRVLLVEDHDMTRKGLLKLLKKYDDLEIVGEAGDGVEAIALAERLMPDVIIMDINMPKLNGIEATRQIIRTSPAKKIIGLSFHEGKEVRAAMFEAGAVDYLTKNGSVKDLYHAICTACSKG